MYLVNRRGRTVHGQLAHRSCAEIGEQVDLALLLVAAEAVPNALRDIAAAGIRFAVVLAAGFDEIGANGRAVQQQITELALELGVTCVGPNCLGFINLVDKVPAWSGRMAELTTGGMAVVSQSGATAHTISAFAAQQNIGVSHVISTGNESMVDTTTMATILIEDERVAPWRCSSSRSAMPEPSGVWRVGRPARQTDRGAQGRLERARCRDRPESHRCTRW